MPGIPLLEHRLGTRSPDPSSQKVHNSLSANNLGELRERSWGAEPPEPNGDRDCARPGWHAGPALRTAGSMGPT